MTLARVLPLLLALLAALPPSVAGAQTPAAESIVSRILLEEAADAARLDLTMAGGAAPRLVLLRNPYRIAIDFDRTLSAAQTPAIGGKGLVRAVQQGMAGGDRYRLILTLRGPAIPTLEREERGGGSVVRLGLRKGGDGDFALPAAAVAAATPSVAAAGAERRPFLVMLDPGHGGIDRGATGEGGTDEKTVNLAFGLVLRDALLAHEGIEVQMTRTDDTFIPLAERSAIARRAGADLFLSLHADSIRYRDLRGATVYTLSDNASDQLSREVAESENASDRFAGPTFEGDVPEIHDILVDLVRRETESFSDGFATRLVAELRRGEIRLINNPRRSAGFRVLRAPDVPSILFEMGYISNEEDEKMLLSAEWQERLAGIVASAIADFATETRGAGR